MSETVKDACDKFVHHMELLGCGKPIAIELDRKAFESMKAALPIEIFLYADQSSMPRNEMLYWGVLYIAPKNCFWR